MIDPISRYSMQQIKGEDLGAVLSALRSDWLTQGPMVEHFENALAEYVGARHAVMVSSGTAALYLCALVTQPAIWQTSPLSFVATANAFLLYHGIWDDGPSGLEFMDVEPSTGNVTRWRQQWNFNAKTVRVPVHYAGRAAVIPNQPDSNGEIPPPSPAPPPSVIIEDACHALGAMDFDGCSRVGSCAHSLATVFSFHPVKPITTGEGGAVTTNDEGLVREIKSLRDHGRENGLMVRLGTNARMTELQAALGLSQLKRCDAMREIRGALASAYFDSLVGIDDSLTLPRGGLIVRKPTSINDRVVTWDIDEPDSVEWTSAWHLYPIRIKGGRRDEVKAKLNAQGIGAQIHYSPPIHLHPYYRQSFGYKPGDFPEAEAWANEELSLPLHAGMNEGDVERVCVALREALS